MKKVFLTLALILIAGQTWAAPLCRECTPVTNNYNTYINNDYLNSADKDNQAGVKLDAPNLVRLSNNWYAGVEGTKDFANTGFNEGWGVYGKLTYSGTLLDLTKK